MKLSNIEIFEHTADVGLRTSRSSLELLFCDAALGMFHIIAPECTFLPLVEKKIKVFGDDYEQLMVNWLSELNFLYQTELLAPASFDLHFDGYTLQATVLGEIVNPEKHNIEIEIKAVTYHKIFVQNKDGQWRAQIIFDI